MKHNQNSVRLFGSLFIQKVGRSIFLCFIVLKASVLDLLSLFSCVNRELENSDFIYFYHPYLLTDISYVIIYFEILSTIHKTFGIMRYLSTEEIIAASAFLIVVFCLKHAFESKQKADYGLGNCQIDFGIMLSCFLRKLVVY